MKNGVQFVRFEINNWEMWTLSKDDLHLISLNNEEILQTKLNYSDGFLF